MSSHVFLKMGRMTKMSSTLGTDKPRLVEMNQHVIIQRMLPSEGRRAELTNVWFQTGMFLIVKNQPIGRGKLLVRTNLTLIDQRLVSIYDDRFRRGGGLLTDIIDIVQCHGSDTVWWRCGNSCWDYCWNYHRRG